MALIASIPADEQMVVMAMLGDACPSFFRKKQKQRCYSFFFGPTVRVRTYGRHQSVLF
jgi:hypothetical protein